jgi:hypothetical protein
VKVMALIYGDEKAWEGADGGDREAVYARYRSFAEAAGEKVVTGAELARTRAATTVRVRDGETIVTDGPFAETKEQLGGFYVLDCDSLDEAGDLATKIPGAEWGAVEIRAAHEEEAS